ncbi:sulfatase family protein [Dankookia sp. P2]|uniref:sulfatase family protein n=1 Tax=Dankookia sp. P2 TaxID=3423955 RepID=UPI003D672579
MNWPGRIPAGKVDGLAHVVDMLPTLAKLAGAPLDKAKPLDGLDIWPHVTGQAPSPRTEIVYNVEPFRAAVRQGDWKLLIAALLPARVELYDLAKDIGETTNLAAAKPDVVARLQARIDALAQEAVQPLLLTEMLRATFGAPPSTPEFTFVNDD